MQELLLMKLEPGGVVRKLKVVSEDFLRLALKRAV